MTLATSRSLAYISRTAGRLLVQRVGRVEHAGQADLPAAGGRRGHRLGDAVTDRVRIAEHPGRVLDRGLGLDGAEGDDLRDPVLAPTLRGVADDLTAAALVEVDVDVGHRDPVGIEEPLEDQPVQDRVQTGDPQRVGDQRAGRRATAGADGDAVGLRPAWAPAGQALVPGCMLCAKSPSWWRSNRADGKLYRPVPPLGSQAAP
jgi:hypothetical protein